MTKNALSVRLTVALQFVMMLATLGAALTGLGIFAPVAAAAAILFFVLASLGPPSVLTFFCAVIAGCAGLALATGRAEVLFAALGRAAAFAALFTALSMIIFPARHSATLLRAGRHLIAQPAGRRYVALTLGGHLFGVVLNIGALGMLGVMVRNATEPAAGGCEGSAGAGEAADAFEQRRRALLATLRGFITMPAWSPLSITPAILVTIVPSIDYWELLPQGIVVALCFMTAGWLHDRATRRAPARPAATSAVRDYGAIAGLLGIVAALILFVVAVKLALGLELMEAATVSVPVAAAAWVAWRKLRGRGSAEIGLRAMLVDMPRQRRETGIMASAGFLSVAVPGLAPLDLLGTLFASVPAGAVALPVLVMWSIVLAAQVGVTPLVAMTLIGATLAGIEGLDLLPRLLLASYMCGWIIAGQTSPFTANTMMIGSAADTTAFVVRRWNAGYSATMLVVCSLVLIGWGAWT